MYGLIGKMKVVSDQRDALISILIEGVAGMPGCLSYFGLVKRVIKNRSPFHLFKRRLRLENPSLLVLANGLRQHLLVVTDSMKVYPHKINEIVHGKRSITADTALRLSRYFGTTAELWLNLQTLYDLEITRDAIEEQVVREVTHLLIESSSKKEA